MKMRTLRLSLDQLGCLRAPLRTKLKGQIRDEDTCYVQELFRPYPPTDPNHWRRKRRPPDFHLPYLCSVCLARWHLFRAYTVFNNLGYGDLEHVGVKHCRDR